jgi:hypothetical protein
MLVAVLPAQNLFPLSDVEAGMKAVGRTVFAGSTIEEFDVEILGVLENVGPKQSLIIGRLSGGPLEKAGVMAGMSGSPVYIDGRLAGAVAFSFPFSTEPLAGIRPIEQMVAGFEAQDRAAQLVPLDMLADLRRAVGIERPLRDRSVVEPQFLPIATPVSLAGFSARTAEVFGDQLRELGLRPVQGAGGGLRNDPGGAIEPGSMISVGLIRGDLQVNAAGTVTHVDGNRVFAFGHRFISSGDTELPMMRASVLTLVPNLNNSFKLAGTGGLVGKISLDREAGIAGELGDGPQLVPCHIRLRTSAGGNHEYNLELVRDSQLTPFLLQMAVFSAIDATERSLGPLTANVKGKVRFAAGAPDLVLDDIYSGTANVGADAAQSTAIPLAFITQSGFADLEVTSIDIEIEATPEERYSEIVRAWVSSSQVQPGQSVEITAVVKDPDGAETPLSFLYEVPVSMPPGAVNVTVSDASSLNILEWRGLLTGRKSRGAGEMIRLVNRLRRSDQAYVRLWQPKRSLWVHSERLPSPPASLQAVLQTAEGRATGAAQDLSSTLAESVLGELDSVVRGRVDLQFVVTQN